MISPILLIISLDAQLLKEGNRVRDKVEGLQNKFEDKINEYKQKQEFLNTYRNQVSDKIDSFFDQVIKRVNERREKLKQDYKVIEAKEKRRLKSKQMKMERDLQELKSFSADF